jgi:hypothetical protein
MERWHRGRAVAIFGSAVLVCNTLQPLAARGAWLQRAVAVTWVTGCLTSPFWRTLAAYGRRGMEMRGRPKTNIPGPWWSSQATSCHPQTSVALARGLTLRRPCVRRAHPTFHSRSTPFFSHHPCASGMGYRTLPDAEPIPPLQLGPCRWKKGLVSAPVIHCSYR